MTCLNGYFEDVYTVSLAKAIVPGAGGRRGRGMVLVRVDRLIGAVNSESSDDYAALRQQVADYRRSGGVRQARGSQPGHSADVDLTRGPGTKMQ